MHIDVMYTMSSLFVRRYAGTYVADESNGIFAYVCTKETLGEAPLAENTSYDPLARLATIKGRNKHSHTVRGHPGVIIPDNDIVRLR